MQKWLVFVPFALTHTPQTRHPFWVSTSTGQVTDFASLGRMTVWALSQLRFALSATRRLPLCAWSPKFLWYA